MSVCWRASSNIKNKIELSCDWRDEVLFDECVSECDSDECFYDCINCDSENECVKCVEDICGVDDIGVLNKCENFELVRVHANNLIKNGDYKFKNRVEGFVSDEPCVKENSLHDVCIPLKQRIVNNSNYMVMILTCILLLIIGHSFFYLYVIPPNAFSLGLHIAG